MTDHGTKEQRPAARTAATVHRAASTARVAREAYSAPQLIELDVVSKVTLGKYAEDSADKGRYFE
ncbi:hypothetical protein AB0I82_04235 [Streptomyces sp. NPDC050315]|uniref:hypothetical protein n=1 Tax=Streptomyces sp. NPDC050315 TaxID=3155039 RepID=UPI00341523AB